jgi:hypothetical protein
MHEHHCRDRMQGADEPVRFGLSLGGFFRAAAAIMWRDPGSALVLARMALRQRKAAARRRSWRERGVQVPPVLVVSVTRRCNLRCAGCFVHAQGLPCSAGGEGSGETRADEFRARREAAGLGVSVVALAGAIAHQARSPGRGREFRY